MKFLSTFVLLATLSVFAEAVSLHHHHVHRFNHNGIARRANNTRRCRQRNATNTDISKSNTSTNSTADDQSNNDSSNSNPAPNTSGVINVQDNRCGPSGATQQVTQTSGPNGSIDWLNCGIEDSGWNPPDVQVTDLITVDLDDAIAQGGPFNACEDYIWAFKQYGNQYGIPPILLAAIALQESICNPKTIGGAGEQGLMQLTPEKCGGAPGGNCLDIAYNVETGAKYFADTLAANGGNVIQTWGVYNGWKPGMTVAYATRMSSTNCRSQNNLDYLQQMANGWVLNKDAYSLHLGKYFNLDSC